jgi:hypothetical protein
MSIDDDLSASLPKAPPPNPSRREAAIEAALRRFDGTDQAPAAPHRPPASPPWWARLRQPQFGVAVSAAVVAAIGLPAALIAIRDRSPAPVQETVAPPAAQYVPTAPPGSNAMAETQQPPPAAPVAKPPPAVPSSAAPEVPAQQSDQLAAQASNEAKAAPPAPAFAPAPPPPAPQAAPVVAERAGQVSDMVVTGSRIRSPNLDRTASKAVERAEAASAGRSPADAADHSAYAAFVTRLQSAVRANDRSAVIKLIGFPLRVNSSGRSRFYPNARSVERDFDRIFTPRVRQSILAQQPDQLFIRDQGAMIGDGEVWFDHTCLDSGCTALGPVRITSVNP